MIINNLKTKQMGEVEQGKCDFCKEFKPVERTYLRPTKYVKSNDLVINNHLYNQGSYFIIVKTCNDCGIPKLKDSWLREEVIELCKKAFISGLHKRDSLTWSDSERADKWIKNNMETIIIDDVTYKIEYKETHIGDRIVNKNNNSIYIATIADADDLNWIVIN